MAADEVEKRGVWWDNEASPHAEKPANFDDQILMLEKRGKKMGSRLP